MISVFGSHITDVEINNVVECLKSQWLGFGNQVEEFEGEFKAKFNLPSFIMVDNCSNGLYMAVRLLGLPPGSKIIVPSFTWVACAQSVLLAGHQPVFADVDIFTMNITRETIDECLERHPDAKAIMVVHYAGLPVEMNEILGLGLPIIEDAAHAVYSLYNGVSCGAIGDIGVYSFDAIKNLTAGDGGGIVCRHKEMIEKAKVMRYCGIGKSGFESAMANKANTWWEYNIQEAFIRMLPNNICASIALGQLKRIEELQARRKEIWDTYQRVFATESWITTPQEAYPDDRHSYFTYCVKTLHRNELASAFLGASIYTTLRYHPLHLNPIYKQMDVSLPNCELLNKECLNLPLHPGLSDGDVERVISRMLSFGKEYGY